MLNDGINPDRSPFHKLKHRQKIRPQASGPSGTHASAYAQSVTKKRRNTVTPENVDKDTELADLEKIMDSFENEDEEKIIGTIVKIDSEGLHGISNSPPKITLKDSVSGVNPSTVPNQGNTSLTTVLDGVTISPKSTNTNDTTASKDTYEMCSQKEVSGVTPANVNLEGVLMLEGVTPVSQMIGEPIKCVLRETVLIHLTNVDPTEGTTTLDSVTGIHMPKQSTSGSQRNADSHPVTPETNNQGNVNVTPPVTSTLDGFFLIFIIFFIYLFFLQNLVPASWDMYWTSSKYYGLKSIPKVLWKG